MFVCFIILSFTSNQHLCWTSCMLLWTWHLCFQGGLMHILGVVIFAAVATHSSICQGTVLMVQNFCSICIFLCFVWWCNTLLIFCIGSGFIFLIISKLLISFKLSSITFSVNCTWILFAQDRSCLLVISLVSFMIMHLFIISVVIIWSLITFTKCCCSHLSISLYSHLWLWPLVCWSILLWAHCVFYDFTLL